MPHHRTSVLTIWFAGLLAVSCDLHHAHSDPTAPLFLQCIDCGGSGGGGGSGGVTNPYGPLDPDPATITVTVNGVTNLYWINPPWNYTASASGGRTTSYIFEWFVGYCGNGCSNGPIPLVTPLPVFVQTGASSAINLANYVPKSAERARVVVRVHENKDVNYFSGVAQQGLLGPAFSKGAGEIDQPGTCIAGITFTEEYSATNPDGTTQIKSRPYQRNYCTGRKYYPPQ